MGPEIADEASTDLVAGYSLLRTRSKGTVGVLHLAESSKKTPVLLRLVSRDLADDSLGRLREDLDVLEDVHNPHIARLVEHGEAEGRDFYVLDDPGGTTLLNLVRSCRPLDEPELVWIGRGLARGLAALHVVHLPHGNLVPGNVAVSPRGPCIVDLGWAPRFGAKAGAIAVEKDLRALGELLVFAASGVRPPPPGKGKPFNVQKRIPWVSERVVGILEALLGPAEKRPSAKEVAKQLEAFGDELGVPVSAPLPSIERLLLKLPDRTRTTESTAGTIDALNESSWELDAVYTLQPGQAILLRQGLELTCERLLGQGGMGVVYLLRDQRLGRLAALKLIRGKNETRIRRFDRETKVTARLDHPGIPPVYEAGRTPAGEDYLLMRFVEGSSLGEILARQHKRGSRTPDVDLRSHLAVMAKVGEAVGYAHSRGIVHRDLKPDNIMVGAFGEVFVMDWGLARNLGESAQEDARVRDDFASLNKVAVASATKSKLTNDGAFLGSPGYMAPEQFRGEEVDGRADVFAMGAILSVILTGSHPFAADDQVEVLTLTAEGQVELPAERDRKVAPELNAIVAKALHADKAYRYTSIEALVSDLRAFLQGREVSVFQRSTTSQVFRLLRNHWLLFSSQVLILALLVGAGIVVTKSTTEALAAKAATADSQRETDARERAEAAQRKVEINGLVAAGKQALEASDNDIAKGYFTKALLLDPDNLDAKVGVRESNARLEQDVTAARLTRAVDKSRNLVASAQAALESGDLDQARRLFIQALGFDGQNEDAKAGIGDVEARESALRDAKRKRKRNANAKRLLLSARKQVEECHKLMRRQADPQQIQEGYLAALASLEKALRVAPSFPAAEKLRVQAAHELYTILAEEGQDELAEFVLRFKELDPPSAGAVTIERDPYLVVTEGDRVRIRRTFPGAVHFLPTTIFDDGLRDWLIRLGKGRFRVSIEVRADLGPGNPPSILATGLWVKLEDKEANVVSPPLKIAFERPFRRRVRLDRHRRLVAPFDVSRPKDAKRYVEMIETRIQSMVKEAKKKR